MTTNEGKPFTIAEIVEMNISISSAGIAIRTPRKLSTLEDLLNCERMFDAKDVDSRLHFLIEAAPFLVRGLQMNLKIVELLEEISDGYQAAWTKEVGEPNDYAARLSGCFADLQKQIMLSLRLVEIGSEALNKELKAELDMHRKV